MMTTIMREFQAYDIQKLLEMPFQHMSTLYSYAETASDLYKYDVAHAVLATHSEQRFSDLCSIVAQRFIPDKDTMRKLLSPDNLKKVVERFKKNSE